jgi:hypothetical protein
LLNITSLLNFISFKKEAMDMDLAEAGILNRHGLHFVSAG